MQTRPFVIVNNATANQLLTVEEAKEFQTKLMGLWERQQRVVGYTDASIALNLRNVNEFLEMAHKFIWEITTEDVDNFYFGLVGRGLAYSTRRKYQSNITTFLDYLRSRHSHEIWERFGATVPTVLDKFNRHRHRKDDHEGVVSPPDPEVLNRFWDGMKEAMKSARKFTTVARDYAIFRTVAMAGLRINETVMLDVKDCRFDLGEKGKIHVRFGKGSRGTGRKARWVPMLDGLDEILHWYLENVRPKLTNCSFGPLFVAESGERLKRDTARGNLRRRQEVLGFREHEIFSPHQLRHAFATEQTERGVDLITLKELLGHEDISTTFTYSTPGSDYLERRVRLSQEKFRRDVLEDDSNKGGDG